MNRNQKIVLVLLAMVILVACTGFFGIGIPGLRSLLAAFLMIACPIATFKICKRYNRNLWGWTISSIYCGVFPIIILWILGPKRITGIPVTEMPDLKKREEISQKWEGIPLIEMLDVKKREEISQEWKGVPGMDHVMKPSACIEKQENVTLDTPKNSLTVNR